MTKKERMKKAKEILKLAEESGIQTNFFFVTTFDRYMTQLNLLDELDEARKEYGNLVTKEYVKGRENLTISPAVSAYNNTVAGANRTAETLLKIIKGFKAEEQAEAVDPLIGIINGGE